jgi:hypothetical protein
MPPAFNLSQDQTLQFNQAIHFSVLKRFQLKAKRRSLEPASPSRATPAHKHSLYSFVSDKREHLGLQYSSLGCSEPSNGTSPQVQAINHSTHSYRLFGF